MTDRRPVRWAALVALGLVLAPVLAAGGAAAAPREVPPHSVGPLLLVAQTPTVARGGTFDVWLDTRSLPADATLDIVLHGRVRSRSELAASMTGDVLRSQVYRVTVPVSGLPTASDGTRRLSVSLDPAVPGSLSLSSPGAYPMEVIARGADGAELSSLITHLLVEPAERDTAPPLAVAVVVALDAPPATPADDAAPTVDLDLARANELVAALSGEPDVPATLAVRPELLDALGAVADPEADALLEALPAAARDRSVLALPYVDVSPDQLGRAGLRDELPVQLEQGRQLLADALGVEPTGRSWLAGPDLGDAGLTALARAGVRHVVVADDQVEALRSGIISLSLAQPFLLGDDLDPGVDAFALDPDVTDRLGTGASPGLELSRLLAELSVLWFEQPGIERGVVVPVDDSVRGAVLAGLLAALDGDQIFRAVTLDDLFAGTPALRQPGGREVDRALTPARSPAIDRTVARDLPALRARLTSFEGLLGPDSPRAQPVADQVLLSTARGLSHEEQRAHLDAARRAIDEVTGGITAPNRDTVTLTAREGTIPLSVRNATGAPVEVMVHLRSPKLEFPGGNTLPVTLTDAMTRLDIDVRVRASGSFPLEVEVTSPDGALSLATVELTVQSTAVSGVGVVLSAGAGLFLLIWWARHWRRTRRSAKLVATTHPAVRDAQ